VLLDPHTLEQVELELPVLPAAVSVAPDGLTAAVAHDAYLTLVDLTTPAVLKTVPTNCDAFDVVLAGNHFAYVFPRTDQWVDIHSIDLEAGIDRSTGMNWAIYAGTSARLHPGGQFMYGLDNALSPTDIERYDISAGVAVAGADSPYHGDSPICGELWFSKDGKRSFNGCGSVFRMNPGAMDDMTYGGTLALSMQGGWGPAFTAIAHGAPAGRVYAIPAASEDVFSGDPKGNEDTAVLSYTDDYLQLQRSTRIPCLDTPKGAERVHGRFLFVSPDGTSAYVLGQLEASVGALNDWAVVSVTP
jgi:hypothetical protein